MNDTLRNYPDRLRAAVEGLSDEALARPEAEGKWSINHVLAHLAQFEMIWNLRVRSILASETPPPLYHFEQNRWIRDVYRGEPAAELIEQIAFIRKMNLDFLSRLREEEWDRVGIHAEYGPNTIRELLARFERHQEKHLGQVERIKNRLLSC